MAGQHKTLLFRADGGTRIGTGHVMRCLSLAQAWLRVGGDVLFALAESVPALEQRLAAAGVRFKRLDAAPGSDGDARQTITLAARVGATLIAADGYHFGADYQRWIKDGGLQLMLMDDYGHAEHYFADFVLNQNLHAHADLYESREPYTRLLLGTRYVLLRAQFLKYLGWQRSNPAVARRVLVTLGGGDPDNVTGAVVKTLADSDVEAKVVVGGANPHVDSLRAGLATWSDRIELVVDAADMPGLMAWADVAVAAGGTTSWELAFMGLPSLVLVLADNQKAVAAALDSSGVARKTTPGRVAGDLYALLQDAPGREEMSRRGCLLVDGDGPKRVVMQLSGTALRLRRARAADCRLFWEWVNEPGARGSAFQSEPIPWGSHVEWFEHKLSSPRCRIFVGEDETDAPVGQVRFEWDEEGDAEVDLCLDKSRRGSGLGAALLRAAACEIFQEESVRRVHAYVKVENVKSLRTFEKAGFKQFTVGNVKGHCAAHFIREREGE